MKVRRGEGGEKKGGVSVMDRAVRGKGGVREDNMPAGGGEGDIKRGGYQREIHEDLHPVSWSHVGHMVKVCRIRNHLGPELRVPQHLPANTYMMHVIHGTHATYKHNISCVGVNTSVWFCKCWILLSH